MNVTYKLKNSVKKLKKDNTEEFNVKVKEIIEKKILNRRIFKAFPKFKINIMGIDEIKNKLEDKVKEFKEKFDEK